jgi:hypothetical protein
MLSGQFLSRDIGYCCIGISTYEELIECSLDGAQNEILPCLEIAPEFRLERQPNAARRQFLPRIDGGTDESRDRGLEDLV